MGVCAVVRMRGCVATAAEPGLRERVSVWEMLPAGVGKGAAQQPPSEENCLRSCLFRWGGGWWWWCLTPARKTGDVDVADRDGQAVPGEREGDMGVETFYSFTFLKLYLSSC